SLRSFVQGQGTRRRITIWRYDANQGVIEEQENGNLMNEFGSDFGLGPETSDCYSNNDVEDDDCYDCRFIVVELVI
ncbi:hypothetical protein Tco_1020429, partial [Tanacetum coccineum]